MYKDIQAGTRRVDLQVEEKICVGMKALTQLVPVHPAQAINYPEACNIETGLPINFGETKPKFHGLENKKFKPSSCFHKNQINHSSDNLTKKGCVAKRSHDLVPK
jgi:hypothetical protein